MNRQALKSQWQHSRLIRWSIQWLLIAVPLFFLLQSIAQNWEAVRECEWQIDPLKGGLAFICLIIAFTLLPLITQQSMATLGYDMPYRQAYQGYFFSQLAKYLPGGIWILPGRVVVFKKAGIEAAASSMGVIIETYLLLLAGSLVFVPYLFFYDAGSFLWVGLGILILLPVMVLALQSRLLPMLAKQFLGQEIKLPLIGLRTAPVLMAGVLFWCCVGTGFFLLIGSIHTVATKFWLPAISAYSMAWVIGFLAFLTPGGLGVREGALALLLIPFLPMPVTAVIVLLSRLWWIAAELFSMGVASLLSTKVTISDF